MRSDGVSGKATAALWAVLFLCLLTTLGHAIEIELQDVAPDRVERQRAYNRGQVPLPSTPDLTKLDERLAAKGLKRGNPIFIRVFKASSELEVWMQKDDRFVLLDTYPVCHWTGTLGPKLKEGDKQSPEGFYSVAYRQMRLVGRWQKAFNLGFPNHYDQINKRTGSFILVHGGCSSVGCFAMTEQVQEEIYSLANAAVKAGQERFQVHVFPFRMTEQAMTEVSGHMWASFWRDLKAGFDSFERTRVPPKVNICESRYHITDGEPGYVGDQKQIGILRPITAAAASTSAQACMIETSRVAQQTSAVGMIETSSVEDDAAPASRGNREKTASRASSAAEDAGKTMVRRKVRRSPVHDQTQPDPATSRTEQPNGFGGTDRKGTSRIVSTDG